MAKTNTNQDASTLFDSLFSNWTNGLERVCTAQKEAENLMIQALENQKETWKKVNEDISRIEDEQQKTIQDLRESFKMNLEKTFGPTSSKLLDQWNNQLDSINSQIQSVSETPYKEWVKLLNQTQERFQQTVKSNLDQQQKVRDNFSEQVISTQKQIFDMFESNTKKALGFFK